MAGPNGHFKAGKGGRIAVGATFLTLDTYEINFNTDWIDTTNFESLGIHPAGGVGTTTTFEQGTFGVLWNHYSFSGKWDAQQPKYDTPPALYPRDDLASVKIYENTGDGDFWNYPFSIVVTTRNGARVRDAITWDASLQSNGNFSCPTGTF